MAPVLADQGWLTPAQAALALEMSGERVRQFTRTGKLPCIWTPLGRLIPAEAVQRLAAERAAHPEQVGRKARGPQ